MLPAKQGLYYISKDAHFLYFNVHIIYVMKNNHPRPFRQLPMMKLPLTVLCCTFIVVVHAQSPGKIVRPAGGSGITALNPNGDGYSSATTNGFTSSDITQSEIPYKVVPPAITEPTGDIATGPSGGFTDIVKTVDNSGFYTYSDGTNLLFRLRIGNIISGSKGYSILIDTDGKIGNSGPYADPNYVAATNSSNGNAGFEYEVVLETNFRVAVYQIDGTTAPGTAIATYALNTNSQISMALTTDGNNPDYFYDWYVPVSAIGSPASFRMVATTVTSPSSALQGSRSDIYGIDDATGGSVATAWTTVINAQPLITPASLGSGGTGVAATCTEPPVVNGPVTTGSNINVTGTWTRLDASKPSTATITLYKNNAVVSTTAVSTGATWSISVPTIAPGDVFYAKAVATGESACLQSASVTAGCASTPAAPVITCASSKGITGTIPTGTTVNIYQVTSANGNPTTTPLSTGLVYVTNAGDITFNYYGTNPQSGNACQGQNGVLTTNTTYMLVSNNGGCLSAPTFICITGASQNSWNYISANTLAFTTPIYPYQTTVSGTGATSGQVLRLFINNKYVSSITATGSPFSFTGLSLNTGDALKVYAQTSGACMTESPVQTVSCYTTPPVITTNSSGNLLTTLTSISGSAASPGATINLYKGTAPSGTLAGTTTANSSGQWTVTGLLLLAGDSYYATQTVSGCTSPASAAATVLAPTLTCPSFAAASYADNASSVGGSVLLFSGTIRLYLDGTLIGSTSVTAATSWSIPVNTNYANTLYPGGVLTVTAQSATGAENTACGSSATITCTSPLQPTVAPLTKTINTGQTVSFAVSNVSSSTWYSIRDNTGASYATANYASSTTGFNLVTNPFNNAGNFTLNISADNLTGCAASTRQALVTVNFVTLPVNFLEVTARYETDAVQTGWTVTNEVNVDRYEVERSEDCIHYTTVATVPYYPVITAQHAYSFRDTRLPATNSWCYRIRQVDKDGRSTLSMIATVQATNRELVWRLSPNPASANTSLVILSPKDQTGTIVLLNMQGQVLYSHQENIRKGSNTFSIPGLQGYAPGLYTVKLQAGQREQSQKLIVAK